MAHCAAYTAQGRCASRASRAGLASGSAAAARCPLVRPAHHRAQAGGPQWLELPVGADHGESGFLSVSGDVRGRRDWDVDAMNETLEFRGAARLRVAQAPDTAHGIIVQLDRMVLNTRRALAHAWASLAQARGFPSPPIARWEQLLEDHPRCTTEHLLSKVLQWSQDPTELQQLSSELSDKHLPAALVHTAEPAPGLQRWLELVASYSLPVAAVTSLRRSTALSVLAHLHLHDHVQALVSSVDDEHESQAQTLLAAALRLGRPPNHCVVFDACPYGVTAAHNASMKAVAVAGRLQPAWQLCMADVTVASLDQLSLINVRRLFANRGTDHGVDLLKQFDPAAVRAASLSRQQQQWHQRRAITTDAQ